MKRGLVIADAGPVISLALAGELSLLQELFEDYYIPQAVWEEVTRDKGAPFYSEILGFFDGKVRSISGMNYLSALLDYGESEALILCKELNADYLLIDDKKARQSAEQMGITCVGTLGVLASAKEAGKIAELKPIFELFLKHKRYYSEALLNSVLTNMGELPLP